MKRKTSRLIACVIMAAMFVALFAGNVFAYDRQEAVEISGGTEVTVYAGTQNSNDQGNYLADPGDYLKSSRYRTAGQIVSSSNITSSTNFVEKIAGGEISLCGGGVEGVSWSGNTLTLDNAKGTVITIEGPEINPYAVNTYNDKLNPNISYGLGATDLSWASNLTYYKQFDLFAFNGETGGAPHTKDNSTVQDTVYIELKGENNFNNIVVSGNVKVIFKGTGKLTLDTASDSWNYDNYSDPNFDHMSDESNYALASIPSIGYLGQLVSNPEGLEMIPMENERMKEIVTEWFEYKLPEFELGEGVSIKEGGTINNSKKAHVPYFAYVGNGEFGTVIEGAEALPNKSFIRYGGTKYNICYNEDQSLFYLEQTVGRGKDANTVYYDITADIVAWEPWCSYVGAESTPASKVIIEGTEP